MAETASVGYLGWGWVGVVIVVPWTQKMNLALRSLLMMASDWPSFEPYKG